MSIINRIRYSSWKDKEGPVRPWQSTGRLVKEFTKKLRSKKEKWVVSSPNTYRCPFCNIPVVDVTAHVDQTPQCKRARRRVG